ncbi:uncharacterized protein [Porites lutea]|uniref:uncharacterized protein n=1 Tax=Porites lutea TaxID=51062 RepID=UPI003CC55E2A
MKSITLVAILLVGCAVVSEAGLTCPCFPDKTSGRMLVFIKHLFVDMPYNLDLKLQRFQSDMKVYTKTSRYPLRVNVIIDYKAKRKYLIVHGRCFVLQYEDAMPGADQLKFLKRIATGRLGMVGAEVGIYIFKKGLTSGVLTMEDNDMCQPQTFTGKVHNIGVTVSYLNIKSTANAYKLRIPYICLKNIGRRTLDDEDEEQPPANANLPVPACVPM